MYVCLCKGITDQQVQCALSECGSDSDALITTLELDSDCCGRCAENIEDLMQVAPESSAQ